MDTVYSEYKDMPFSASPRIVNVVRESEWNKNVTTVDEIHLIDYKFIRMEDLAGVLRFGQPGEYVLRGV